MGTGLSRPVSRKALHSRSRRVHEPVHTIVLPPCASASWEPPRPGSNGAAVDLGTRKQRALLAALALRRGRPVPPDALVDLLWGEAPPAAVTATLQGYVARLRRALEPDRAPSCAVRGAGHPAAGYALLLPDDALDAARFEAAVGAAHQRLGAGVTAGPRATDELERLFADAQRRRWPCGGALPYAELEDAPAAAGRAGPARGAAGDRPRGPGRRGARARAARDGRRGARGADRDLPAARAALGPAGAGADALGPAGRRARGAARRSASCSPRSSASSPAPSCARCRPPCCGRTRRSSGPPAAARLPQPARPAGGAGHRSSRWPLVGRDDQLSALVGLARAVAADQPGVRGASPASPASARAGCAPSSRPRADGRGRHRRSSGAAPRTTARPRSSRGRACSASSAHDLPSGSADEGDERQRVAVPRWESIARTVLDAAAERPLLVLLDDLHWADTSTLRVLRLLAETAESGRLMVVATWRHEPPPDRRSSPRSPRCWPAGTRCGSS